MRTFATALIAFGCCAAAEAACAQTSESMGPISSILDVGGSALARSAVGGDSVFVYAQGSAPAAEKPDLSAVGDGYSVQVTGSGATAAIAVGQRHDVVARLRAVAATYGVSFEVTGQQVTYGDARAVARARFPYNQVAPEDGANASAKPTFICSATVHLGSAPPEKEGAMLDAIRNAGADSILSGDAYPRAMALMFVQPATSAESVAASTWDAASTSAFQSARQEARALAVAAGRDIGAAQQIEMLSRSAQSGQATVLVAVRFALAPANSGSGAATSR
jgi:hypothetical protein